MKIFNNIMEVKRHFGLIKAGIILEGDVDKELNDLDACNRVRHDSELLTTLATNIDKNILEIGTGLGRSTYRLATNTRHTVFTVNMLPEQYAGHKYHTESYTQDRIGNYYKEHNIRNIKQYYANTLVWDMPQEINNIGLSFIDGGHDAMTVLNDSFLCHSRMIHGGYIVWHDFNPDYTDKYDWIKETAKAIDKFLGYINYKGEFYHLKHSLCGWIKL